MQKVILILALCFTLQGMAQESEEMKFPVDEETGRAKYEGVHKVEGVSNDELFTRSIKWINKFYKNPTKVIKKQDKENGVIEGKARFSLDGFDKKGKVMKNVGAVSYHFQIRFRDGRYKYEITRIRYETQSYYDVTKWYDKKQTNYDEKLFNSFIDQTVAYMEKLIADMEENVAKAEKVKSDDW